MPTALEREIAAEQTYVDVVYSHLDEATRSAHALVDEGMARGHIGHEGGLVERDAMVYQASRRINALNAAHDGLVFGRLDMAGGEKRYIGRIGVRDHERDVLLIDWRAPAAADFYQATPASPRSVGRRRILRCFTDQVVGIEDELIDAQAAGDLPIIGDGALMASLSRARDGRMHSVVATIQAEQDEAIRAPARGAVIISGGPGTGKTVVALHRAAFLLYSDRRRFESGGVLVVGPSPVFMAYIEQVLPSLGETSVTLRSIGEVVTGIEASEHDEPAVAAIKGSARMRNVIARTVAAGMPEAPTSLRFFYRDDVLELRDHELAELRQRLTRDATRNEAHHRVQNAVLKALWAKVHGERALEKGEEHFYEEVSTDNRFLEFLEAWWPEFDAVEMWRSMPGRIAELARGILKGREIEVLASRWNPENITIEDVALIDEFRYLLGEVPPERTDAQAPRQLMSFEREERERAHDLASTADDGYAHVLIDEAQDLSPMQWRMVGRRGPTASWTIVGDEVQSSWPDPAESAAARDEALRHKDIHRFRLSKNYRNSAEVYEFAAKVAAVASDSADLAEAVRSTGIDPEHLVGDDDMLWQRTHELLDDVDGTIALVATGATLARLRETVVADERIRVIDPLSTKGLEFDAVVVAEPDEIISESEAGWRTLYVVLTRATQRLVTIGTTRRWFEAL